MIATANAANAGSLRMRRSAYLVSSRVVLMRGVVVGPGETVGRFAFDSWIRQNVAMRPPRHRLTRLVTTEPTRSRKGAEYSFCSRRLTLSGWRGRERTTR